MSFIWCKRRVGEIRISAKISILDCDSVFDLLQRIAGSYHLGVFQNEPLLLYEPDGITHIEQETSVTELLEIYDTNRRKPLFVKALSECEESRSMQAPTIEKVEKIIPCYGPAERSINHMIPLDQLKWGASLLLHVKNKYPVLLHGHWQSGKSTALIYIRSCFESPKLKVVLIDLKETSAVLDEFLRSGYSMYLFLAYLISQNEISTLPNLENLYEFHLWLEKSQKKVLLMIDEYDVLIKARKRFPEEATKALLDMNNLISKVGSEKGEVLHSLVIAGTFLSVATQKEDFMYIDDSDDSLDEIIKPLDSVSPWNKGVKIETEPFTETLIKKFAFDTGKHFNSISEDVIDDIYCTTKGHPGCSMWLLSAAFKDSIGQKLTVLDWLRTKRETHIKALCQSETMSKMINRLKNSKTVKEILLNLIRNNEVECSKFRIIAFFLAIGLAKVVPSPKRNSEKLTFTAPLIRDALIYEMYPSCLDQHIDPYPWSSIPTGSVLKCLILKAATHIQAKQVLDGLVQYAKGLAEAAVHAELYRILFALLRLDNVSVLTESRVAGNSNKARCDLWIKANLVEYGIEIKTECNQDYIEKSGYAQISKYALLRKPQEMMLVSFNMQKKVRLPIQLKKFNLESNMSILFLQVSGSIDNGLELKYATEKDSTWTPLARLN
jgi:hypothetical protein